MKSLAAIPQEKSPTVLEDIMILVKARLSLLVLITTLVGFVLGWRGPLDWLLLASTLIGTALCAGGAAALNQWWERDLDALMKRTCSRPLPAQRMQAHDALLFGLFFSITGLSILTIFTSLRVVFLAFATIAIYILVYTPMKRRSPLNTLVGAVSGALPPLIGWVAARGYYDLEGGLLFAVLWFWQMPHFFAISWMHREDYANAGYAMISTNDPGGETTSRQSLLYALCLLLITLLPGLIGLNSPLYFFVALVLGGIFCGFAMSFALHRDRDAARRLFFYSLLYLPLLLGTLVATVR